MKTKGKTAEKDERSSDRVARYQDAQLVLRLLRKAMKRLEDSGRAAEKLSALRSRNGNAAATKKAEDARERARMNEKDAWSILGLHLWMLCGTNPDNLGEAFEILALAAAGKPLARFDDMLMEAYENERREACKAGHWASIEWFTFKMSRKGLDKQLDAIAEKKKTDSDPKPRPSLRAALRRAKQLGLR